VILDIFQSRKSTDPRLLLLLSVAHRLKTVIDYDRLIVLDKGVVAEFDTPWNLIQKEDGIFRNMAMKSGMFAELERIAKEKAVDHA
jgi:ABC-type multidrug transport system fused ATPase/permease subunit